MNMEEMQERIRQAQVRLGYAEDDVAYCKAVSNIADPQNRHREGSFGYGVAEETAFFVKQNLLAAEGLVEAAKDEKKAAITAYNEAVFDNINWSENE